MNTFTAVSCVILVAAGVLAAPPMMSHSHREPTHQHRKTHEYNPLRELPALRHEEAHDEYGQYVVRYITAENTVVSERGRLVANENGTYYLFIEGQYSFFGDDGMRYVTTYHAGPGGFHVDGDHIPRPVPVVPSRV